MHALTTPPGIAAIIAGGLAIVALILCGLLALRLRRLRVEQLAVLGDRREDLVAHAASLQHQFRSLNDYVQQAAQKLDGRVAAAEQRFDGAVAYRALVRYDAYAEMSGRQSTSIALLDHTRSGIVLSSIHHRDSARVYAKQVHNGRSKLELSPEEVEAVRRALRGDASEELV